jgi:hypothetical protein
MLLSFPSCPDLKFHLDDIVRNSEIIPWWNQDWAHCVPKKRETKKIKKERLLKKSSMSKVEQKQHQALITIVYLD